MFTNRLSNASRKRKGFTLVELLVVVLILAILMAVALPLYLSAVSDAQKKTCRANMQTISNAVQAAYMKGNLTGYSSFVGAVSPTLEPDLVSTPICPSAGTYSVALDTTTGGFKVACSTTGANAHGTFEPGLDSK